VRKEGAESLEGNELERRERSGAGLLALSQESCFLFNFNV
jgi:hypothetical protein